MVSLRKKIIFVTVASCLTYIYIFSKPRRRYSELLQEVLDYTELLKSTEKQIKEFLVENTFDQLVTEHVKPAVDRIASVRKQTEIMEGMERISGGPQNFMSTSFTILDKIQKDLYVWEKEYRLATARIQRYWPKLLELVEKCENKISFFNGNEFFEPLATMNIHFEAMEHDDPDKKRRQALAKKSPKHLEEIMSFLKSQLLPMMQNYESIKIKEKQTPEFQISDIENPKYSKILLELVPHLQKNDVYYESVASIWISMVKHLRNIRDEAISNVILSKQRYEELGVGLDNDITNLKERIQNLKSPKKSTQEL